MKTPLFAALLFLSTTVAGAAGPEYNPREDTMEKDSVWKLETQDVVVRSSAKETNELRNVPGAVSLITPAQINSRGIESIKDVSILVPNLFIPDYGSKMTTPIYLRGIGTRSSGQSVGMYVDNIPYMEKSSFDFEFMDIQRIEVLRGPQGTLYGRNAMGGIINVYTLSPFDYQGHKISLGAGNYGQWHTKLSKYAKLSDKVGLSVAGYWEKEGGYFRNEYTGEKVDDSQSAGGRVKLEYHVNPRLKAILAMSYDYTDQGAYPYGFYDKQTGKISKVNFNDRGSYLRNMTNNSLRFEYNTDKILFTSNTGYQYLRDNMWMDQDFTPRSIFTINQRQRQNSVNQEFTVRSTTDKNYQWSVGTFGFYNHMNTRGDVTFKEDGVRDILQEVFNSVMPSTVQMNILDTELLNPGTYKTPEYGAAIFHQSTFKNLFTDGLSLTLGMRFDYEKQSLRYDTEMAMNAQMVINMPTMPFPITQEGTMGKHYAGKSSQDFFQWLPKIALNYECSENIMTYFTVSKGYKAGGYNNQMFSQIVQDSLKTIRGFGDVERQELSGENVKNALAFKPEITWNYEIGTRGQFFDNRLTGELALFYMDVKDVQLTQFINGGSGRILTNAGRGQSYGVEVSLTYRPLNGLSFTGNYGYTHATFRKYDLGTDTDGENVNYKGNYIPYIPRHTFSVGASYALNLPGKWVEQMTFAAQYSGAGKMFWTEANDISQKFYGTLNAKIGARHDFVRLELWARNILNKEYGSFYFESFGNSFVQKGKPFTCGANLVFAF